MVADYSPAARREVTREGLSLLSSGYFSNQLRVLSEVLFDPEFPETMPEEVADLLIRMDNLSKDIDHVLRERRLLLLPRASHTGELPTLTDSRCREPFPIALSEIVIFTKESKVEYDRRTLGLSERELREKYREEGADEERIFASHERQKQASASLQEALGPVRFVARRTEEGKLFEALAGAKLAVSLGGDNHFQFVSQLIRDDTAVLGVNSDPETSFGALLSLNASEFIEFVPRLTRGEYRFEPWTRFETRLNGKLLAPALCDVFLGERARMYMSRHVLEFEGRSVEQKSSGLLLATGAGSTSWYQSAARFLYPRGDTFSPSARYARFLNTEPSSALVDLRGKPGEIPKHMAGTLFDGRYAGVHSLNDSDGIVSLDSINTHPFRRGSTVKVRLAPEPLWVMRPL